jgi:hypothetical protein
VRKKTLPEKFAEHSNIGGVTRNRDEGSNNSSFLTQLRSKMSRHTAATPLRLCRGPPQRCEVPFGAVLMVGDDVQIRKG